MLVERALSRRLARGLEVFSMGWEFEALRKRLGLLKLWDL